MLDVADGNTDIDAIRKAVEEAKAVTDKPTVIVTHTLIGYGSPNKVNSYAAHGAPLGADETELTRKELGWSHAEFEVPDEVYKTMRDACVDSGAAVEEQWDKDFAAYKEKYPELAAEFEQINSGELPADWDKCLPTFSPEDKGLATRQHSQTMLNAIAPALPGFLGGSADLAGSNLTLMKMFGDFQKTSYAERNMRYGVREHGMGAISNGAPCPARRPCHLSGLPPRPPGRRAVAVQASPRTRRAWCRTAPRSSSSRTTCAPRCAWRRSRSSGTSLS